MSKSTHLVSFQKELALTPITNLAENLKREINVAYLVTILKSKDTQFVLLEPSKTFPV